jgi:hypothetical protein
VRAVVVTALPGRAELEPARGATVTLVGTALRATADADGNVRLDGLTVKRGRLLFSLDLDGDGEADQSRLISLEAVQAGYGRDVNLGQVVLSRNATVVGVVRRGDREALPTGHGGISVFLPQLPQLTWSGDDGSFVLRGVPEGNVVMSFFAPGYRAQALALDVGAGQEVRIATVVLDADPGASPVGRLVGQVRRLDDDSPIAAVQVRAAASGMESQSQTSAEGTFALETLPTGVYAVALHKSGLSPLRLDGVLVAPGVNDLGTLLMTDGSGSIALDGGPSAPDAGTGDAGSGDAGSGDAGSGDAGSGDAGSGDAGSGDAGSGDAGSGDAGTGDAGSGDAGTGDAGPGDAGVGPVAVVGAPQVVARGSVVTLNGTASFGDFPLRYRWTQVSGPMVTLSSNDLVTSHSPTFTAPSTPVLLEFSLEVIDRNGLVSTNLAVARVSVSGVPVARFVPDGGLVFGGQTLQLQSTSFDDGGLVLVAHDWRLGSGSAATLVTDGGPLAQVTFTALQPGSPDALARVELQVTNAVGATSPTFARDFTVRAGASTNWSVAVTPVAAVNVGVTPPTVNLNATLSLPMGAPTPTVSWSCAPAQALVGANTLTPSFIAPQVAGSPITVTCSVLASGAAPLQPAMQSAMVTISFLDQRDPTFVSMEEPGRSGPWGRTVRFSEPMGSGNVASAGCSGNGLTGALLPFASWGVPYLPSLVTGSSCGTFTISGTDLAANSMNPNASTGGYAIQTVWEGPFISTSLHDDPRPVLPSVSQAPLGTWEQFKTPAPRAAPLELLASGPGTLVRFDVDPAVSDAGCSLSTGCPLAESTVALPWVVGGAILTRRAFSAADSLFVAFQTDAGLALLERRADGGFLGPMTPPGQPISSRSNSVTQLDAVEFNADAGALDRWRWDPATRSWNRGDRVVAGLSSVAELAGNERQVVALVGPSRTLTVWTYGVNPAVNPTIPAWYNFPTPTALMSAPAMRDLQSTYLSWNNGTTIFAVFHFRTNGSLGLYRLFDLTNQFASAFPGDRTWGGNPNAAINGMDWVTRGEQLIGVRAENGQIILSTLDHSLMAGSSTSVTFPGPPRAGPGPYPVALNADLACEGAHPRLAMVDDRLFITWQERCLPETRWRVVMRVVR